MRLSSLPVRRLGDFALSGLEGRHAIFGIADAAEAGDAGDSPVPYGRDKPEGRVGA